MDLPKDIVMLLSFTNTKLRDEFQSLESFCKNYNITKDELTKRLESINYFYNEKENQFK